MVGGQVGGDHYEGKGACPYCDHPLQHWDVAWAFRFNCFQYIITKWAFRKKGPEGRHLISDLEKIIHAAQKYIEVTQRGEDVAAGALGEATLHGAGPGYVDQDR